MKRHRQLALVGLVACVTLFSACNKNEQASTSAPPTPALALRVGYLVLIPGLFYQVGI